jgi:hypothetical protein
MGKPLKVAGEVDSWCTSCRMMLNHRIVSMIGVKPHQVLCLTCNKSHLYKAHAPGERPQAQGGARTSRDAAPRSARIAAPTRAEAARLGREREWLAGLNARAIADYMPYNVSTVFSTGDVVRHKKFGDGVVTRVIDAQKIEVLFKDEPKTLAHGLK